MGYLYFFYNLRNLTSSTKPEIHPGGWRRGVVVSGVRRMNEVNARRARLVRTIVLFQLHVFQHLEKIT